MKYTFKTYQHGAHGADAAIFRDGVHVHTTALCQSFGANDSDRKKAARVAREWIAEQERAAQRLHAFAHSEHVFGSGNVNG